MESVYTDYTDYIVTTLTTPTTLTAYTDYTNSLMLNLHNTTPSPTILYIRGGSHGLVTKVVVDFNNRHLWTCWADSWPPNFPSLPPPLFIFKVPSAQTIIIIYLPVWFFFRDFVCIQ